jgi:hypothetical protein
VNLVWVVEPDGSRVLHWLGDDGRPGDRAVVVRETDAIAAGVPSRPIVQQPRPPEDRSATTWPVS